MIEIKKAIFPTQIYLCWPIHIFTILSFDIFLYCFSPLLELFYKIVLTPIAHFSEKIGTSKPINMAWDNKVTINSLLEIHNKEIHIKIKFLA